MTHFEKLSFCSEVTIKSILSKKKKKILIENEPKTPPVGVLHSFWPHFISEMFFYDKMDVRLFIFL